MDQKHSPFYFPSGAIWNIKWIKFLAFLGDTCTSSKATSPLQHCSRQAKRKDPNCSSCCSPCFGTHLSTPQQVVRPLKLVYFLWPVRIKQISPYTIWCNNKRRKLNWQPARSSQCRGLPSLKFYNIYDSSGRCFSEGFFIKHSSKRTTLTILEIASVTTTVYTIQV